MTDLEKRLAQLSPEKRQLLLRQLAQQKKGDRSEVQPIPRLSRETNIFPISFSQERLWFLDRLEPENAAYNIPAAFRLKGILNLSIFENSLSKIFERHEALRTTFIARDEKIFQVIQPAGPFKLTVVDLKQLPVTSSESEVQRLISREAMTPFDLSQGPLVRASVLEISQEEHIFLLTMHHIISDGWSVGVFIRELQALYTVLSNNEPGTLPELPIQYADFAQWQREWLQGDRLESQLAYWRKQLGGNLSQLEVLLDHPRPPVQSHLGRRANLSLPPSLVHSLKHLSREEDATLFMTLLAAFKLLLHRHTGVEDILVGSPIAGRTRAELEPMVGFFLNTLVLRTDLSGNPSFRKLVQRVKKIAIDAYTYQDVPFEKLLIELQPERSLNRTPFFQIFFNMLNLEERQITLPDLTMELIETVDLAAKFDITLYLTEKSQALELNLVYNPDLFTHERMEEMLSQYHFLLLQIAASPDEKIDSFSLSTSQSRAVLPDPRLSLDAGWRGSVHAQFSQNALESPGRTALVDSSGCWTYQELELRSNHLAHFLLAHGLKPQEVVAVYGYRNASLVWAILGILKAGAAFLILDPAYPAARHLDYLNIANPRGFIQLEAAGAPHPDLEAWLSYARITCRISLPSGPSTRPHELLDSQPSHFPDVLVGPDDLAAVSFTSGSTGKPKGVMGRHGPLSHFIPWQQEIFSLSPDDHFSMLSGLSHDPLQRDIFTALWVGASVHIPNPEKIGTPGWLSQWMLQEHITFSHFTPAMAQLLSGSSGGTDIKLPDLRYAFFVGDKLTRHDVSQLGKLAPNVICINSYGSTETQRAVGYSLVDPKEIAEGSEDGQLQKAVLPVGRGMKDVQLLIFNQAQQPAGVGELGEIFVRSPHLAKGYLGDDSLTRQRFLPNPFTDTPGDRMYRSGDLGRYLPDGRVEFLGRKDTQVKIRGFRIELGEIEAVLNKHPQIKQSVISVWEMDPNDKRLVAYYVPKSKDGPEHTELREFLSARLPVFMVPARFISLDAIPITPNGKIDRTALPAPDFTNVLELVSPRNITEEKLVNIWEEILQVKPIGINDNFFELGGHSLLAVHMFSRINQEFDVNLPLATLFRDATIASLAEVILEKSKPAIWSSLIEIEPQGENPPFFCVHGLTGDILWFRELAHCLAPEYPFYGLQSRGLDGIQPPFERIEQMAAHYIEEIRLLQPRGPYYLGGASFGGTVALEMAEQLMAQGEEVALLAVFDHAPPNINMEVQQGKMRRTMVISFKMLKNLPGWTKEFMQLGPSRMMMRIQRKLRLIRKAKGSTDITQIEDFEAEDLIDFAAELSAHRKQLITCNYQALKGYIPKPYSGKVTLFRAMNRPLLNTFDPASGWEKLAPGRVAIHDVPSSHEGMFKMPYVEFLANTLKHCFNDRPANK